VVGGVPLREVLTLASLAHARVVAGRAGLDRHVRHVNVMEVPDILRWVNEDELLLTTAYPLRDAPGGLAALVPGLAEKGLAGLAVKPARYIDVIPPEMLQVADQLAFPLIELPPESSFNEIINSVLTVILNAQAARLQRSAEIHERFTGIVLGGGGLRQIAQALAEAIGRPISILDAQGALQVNLAGPAGRDGLRAVVDLLGTPASSRGTYPVALTLDGRPFAVQPIQVGTERFGAIVIEGTRADLSEEEVDAVQYAATVAALRQVQARAVAEADRRFQSVCLEELVAGHVDREVLAERANAFTWDLAVPRAVLIASLDELDGRPFAQVSGTPEGALARRRLGEATRAALTRRAITWERSAEIAALVPVLGEGGLAGAGERLLAEARRTVPGATVSIGVGRISDDPLGLSASHRDARRALQIGRWARGPGNVVLFEDLGVDRLLVALSEAELADFAATTLGPLLDHDLRHRTELAATLEMVLATRNAALAARRLFVHYNTLKNRLRLIEELLGPVLEDPEKALALTLALRIRRRL
jgi:PucR family transcriptional regulator, purine catabolism regulatory protein